jgi:hypothetical protein
LQAILLHAKKSSLNLLPLMRFLAAMAWMNSRPWTSALRCTRSAPPPRLAVLRVPASLQFNTQTGCFHFPLPIVTQRSAAQHPVPQAAGGGVQGAPLHTGTGAARQPSVFAGARGLRPLRLSCHRALGVSSIRTGVACFVSMIRFDAVAANSPHTPFRPLAHFSRRTNFVIAGRSAVQNQDFR